MPYKSFFNWSGGKDSALALFRAMQDPQYKIEKLLTNINQQHRRISMHGVREELVEQQARAIGLPLQKLMVPEQPTMEEYEKQLSATLHQLHQQQFTHAFFGDIFLEDLKKYREIQLTTIGLKAVFPLWKKNTRKLLQEFIDLGFKTIIVCVNAQMLDKSFAGRIIDKDFINDLPGHVDACGEYGEFHTFVVDGPLFSQPIEYVLGEVVYREYKAPANEKKAADEKGMGFWFQDLMPVKRQAFETNTP